MEDAPYKWTVAQTKQLIQLRMKNEKMFTKRRNATKEAWEFIIKELHLEGVTHKQASKKWENLKNKYKELRMPPTGSGTDQGEETPASWTYYLDMHEAMGSKPSVTPPVLIASCMSNPTIQASPSGTSDCDLQSQSDPTFHPSTSRASTSSTEPHPSTSRASTSSTEPHPSTSRASTSSTEPPLPPPAKKRRTCIDGLMDVLQQEAEKEDERHRELVQETKKFVALFEKMVDKM